MSAAVPAKISTAVPAKMSTAVVVEMASSVNVVMAGCVMEVVSMPSQLSGMPVKMRGVVIVPVTTTVARTVMGAVGCLAVDVADGHVKASAANVEAKRTSRLGLGRSQTGHAHTNDCGECDCDLFHLGAPCGGEAWVFAYY